MLRTDADDQDYHITKKGKEEKGEKLGNGPPMRFLAYDLTN